jgi:hypothetical protein
MLPKTAWGPESDLKAVTLQVRFALERRPEHFIKACRTSARNGLMHRSTQHRYSITSSARASSVDGISMPSALAVLRLMTSSYLVGFCTGKSASFSPLRMRST